MTVERLLFIHVHSWCLLIYTYISLEVGGVDRSESVEKGVSRGRLVCKKPDSSLPCISSLLLVTRSMHINS